MEKSMNKKNEKILNKISLLEEAIEFEYEIIEKARYISVEKINFYKEQIEHLKTKIKKEEGKN